MEFPFNVNRLFKKKITKVQNDLVPEGCADIGVVGRPHSEQVAKIVDAMGIASAESQNLYRPVTSADKLKKSDHLLYVMTEPDANNKNGSVVGFLKTGYKNLYLFDKNSRNHETKPLCILDFYIHESMQRRGLGKQLFDHMLHDVDISPKYLAMDKPSDSFMRFIKKHYGLFKTIPQAINYVIYDDFFNKRPDGKHQYASRIHGRVPLSEVRGPKKRQPSQVVTPPPSNAPPPPNDNHGRFAAFKPPSTVGECFSYGHMVPSVAASDAARAVSMAAGAPPDAGDAPEMYSQGMQDPSQVSGGAQMVAMPGGGMVAMMPVSPGGMHMVQMVPGTPGSPGGQMMTGGASPNGNQMGSPGTPPAMDGAQMQPMQGGQMPGTPMQGMSMPGTPMQGMPMPGQQMQGCPQPMTSNQCGQQGGQMQGMQMQGAPMQGAPMQGTPMQGTPMQGAPMQGGPMQGAPMQGAPMHPVVSPLVAAGDGIGQGPATPATSVVEAAGMPVCKGGPRSYENMRKTHYTHTPLW